MPGTYDGPLVPLVDEAESREITDPVAALRVVAEELAVAAGKADADRLIEAARIAYPALAVLNAVLETLEGTGALEELVGPADAKAQRRAERAENAAVEAVYVALAGLASLDDLDDLSGAFSIHDISLGWTPTITAAEIAAGNALRVMLDHALMGRTPVRTYEPNQTKALAALGHALLSAVVAAAIAAAEIRERQDAILDADIAERKRAFAEARAAMRARGECEECGGQSDRRLNGKPYVRCADCRARSREQAARRKRGECVDCGKPVSPRPNGKPYTRCAPCLDAYISTGNERSRDYLRRLGLLDEDAS